MTLGRQNRPGARIGGRGLGATVGPGLQILQRVDDAAAEFAVSGTRAIGPMLFKGASGQTQESRGLGRAQVAQRVQWRVDGDNDGEGPRRGMPKMRGSIFDTLKEKRYFFRDGGRNNAR
jgi:hypothetical protein